MGKTTHPLSCSLHMPFVSTTHPGCLAPKAFWRWKNGWWLFPSSGGCGPPVHPFLLVGWRPDSAWWYFTIDCLVESTNWSWTIIDQLHQIYSHEHIPYDLWWIPLFEVPNSSTEPGLSVNRSHCSNRIFSSSPATSMSRGPEFLCQR